ncbi:hypothetical protein [Streptomyces sp. EN27]|uniref:hypothetical protein n=1 Tax=Streptomyces sp. EN27 TaxID=211464 RepID=UPI0008519062|nr:hypothetical protein [Streptomyces sp. EN27]
MKPARHHLARCRRCSAPIVWCLTSANGKRQPVNYEPDETGNVAVMQGADGKLYVRAVTAARPEIRPGEWQAKPHQATCPARQLPGRSSAPSPRAVQGVRPVPWQR